jgi:hypothetical protein
VVLLVAALRVAAGPDRQRAGVDGHEGEVQVAAHAGVKGGQASLEASQLLLELLQMEGRQRG